MVPTSTWVMYAESLGASASSWNTDFMGTANPWCKVLAAVFVLSSVLLTLNMLLFHETEYL